MLEALNNNLMTLDTGKVAKIRRQAEYLGRKVSNWAQAVVSIIPSSLPLDSAQRA